MRLRVKLLGIKKYNVYIINYEWKMCVIVIHKDEDKMC